MFLKKWLKDEKARPLAEQGKTVGVKEKGVQYSLLTLIMTATLLNLYMDRTRA